MKEYIYVYEEGKVPGAFKSIPFMTSFSPRHLRTVLASARIRDYDPDETVIQEGATDQWMFFLLSGELRVVKDGKTVAGFTHAGDLFGEMTIITGEPRFASVVASTRAICLAIDWSFANCAHTKEEPSCCLAVSQLFVGILAKRLQQTTQLLTAAQSEVRRLQLSPPGNTP